MFKDLNKKKSIYETNIIIGYIITGLAFVFYLPLGSVLGVGAFFVIAIPFLGGAVFASKNHKKIKELSNDFKAIYVNEAIQKTFEDSRYQHDYGFSEDEVVESRLFKVRDRYKSEDFIEGQFEGVAFKCCDVEQKEVRGSGKNRRVVTTFQGRFYEFDFPKKFKHDLVLLQPSIFQNVPGLKKVKTESIHFNSELHIFAENDHEVFYLLTPHFMEKLIYFDQKYIDKISFSFKDNKLYIAHDSRVDYFDLKAFKHVDEHIFDQYQEELKDIQELIKILKLDDHLFR